MTTVAIIPRGVPLAMPELSLVASAINVQVTRDLAPAWHVQANVAAFPDDTEPLAHGFVPVYVVADTGGSDGVHRHPDSGTIFALVRYSPGMRWSLAASHEILELLVDPTLHFTLPGPLAGQPAVTVQYLVEICDPCEGSDYAYLADDAHGIYVSDFCLPSFYWKSPSPTGPYSLQDSLSGPGTIASGGRLTWRDAEGVYSQRTSIGGPERVVGNLTEDDLFGTDGDRTNVRGAIDRHGFGVRRGPGRLRPLAPPVAPAGPRVRRRRGQAAAEMERYLRSLVGTDRKSAGSRQRRKAGRGRAG
jgi:hypothetical protein